MRRRRALAVFLGIGVLAVALAVVSTHKSQAGAPFAAAYLGDEVALGKWLDAGGNPNLMDDAGMSLLYLATGPKGDADTVRVLLEHGADPNSVSDGADSPLMNAAMWVKLECVKLLVAKGADVSYRANDGRRAIDLVGRDGHHNEDAIRQVLERTMTSDPLPPAESTIKH